MQNYMDLKNQFMNIERQIMKEKCSLCDDKGFCDPFPCVLCGKEKERDMRPFARAWRLLFRNWIEDPPITIDLDEIKAHVKQNPVDLPDPLEKYTDEELKILYHLILGGENE